MTADPRQVIAAVLEAAGFSGPGGCDRLAVDLLAALSAAGLTVVPATYEYRREWDRTGLDWLLVRRIEGSGGPWEPAPEAPDA